MFGYLKIFTYLCNMKKIILLLFLLPIFCQSQNIKLDNKTFIIKMSDFESDEDYTKFDNQLLTYNYDYTIDIDTIQNDITVYRDDILTGESSELNFIITNKSDDNFNVTYRIYDDFNQVEGFLVISGGDLILLGLNVGEEKKYIGFMGYIDDTL